MTAPEHTEPKSGGSDLGKSLTSKVAGVPVWGIGVVFALVVIGVIWYRGKLQNAQANTSTGDSVDPTAAEDSVNGNPIDDLLSSDPTNSAFPVGLTAQGTPAPITNTQWSRLALDELIAKGDDPTLVSNALSKYLGGQTLNAAEQGIVNLALTMFGAPPEGVIPIQTTTPPTNPPVVSPPSQPPVSTRPPTGIVGTPVAPVRAPAPAPAPTTRQYVTVVKFSSSNPAWNSTFSGIAAHEHLTITQLKRLNPQILNINLIYPGQRIRVA